MSTRVEIAFPSVPQQEEVSSTLTRRTFLSNAGGKAGLGLVFLGVVAHVMGEQEEYKIDTLQTLQKKAPYHNGPVTEEGISDRISLLNKNASLTHSTRNALLGSGVALFFIDKVKNKVSK